MDRMEPADEQKFEVTTDVHGVSEGPKLGRQRVINKVPFFHTATYPTVIVLLQATAVS